MFIDLNATLHQPGSEERNATRPLAFKILSPNGAGGWAEVPVQSTPYP